MTFILPSSICVTPTEVAEMTVEFKCEFPGCTVVKKAETEETALGLLKLHQANVHSNGSTKQRPPKVERPQITGGVTAEDWATFSRRWDTFKSATDMSVAEAKCQLLACCEQGLEASLFKDDPDLRSKDEESILIAIRNLAVIDVAATVRITELLQMKQDHGEGVRAYVARARGIANICALEKTCTCGAKISYKDELVRWVILSGLSSPDIAREVLGTQDIDGKSLTDTIAIIESKERAARAFAGEAAVSAASTYRKEKKTITISCKECGKVTPKFGRNRRGKQVEYSMCVDCFRASRSRQTGSKPPKDNNSPTIAQDGLFEALGTLCEGTKFDNSATLGTTAIRNATLYEDKMSHGNSSIMQTAQATIDNLVFDTKSGWQVRDSKKQPTIALEATIDQDAYAHIGRRCPSGNKAVLQCISDTGAQACLMGLPAMKHLGLKQADLVPVKRKMRAVNRQEISLHGAAFLKLTGCDKAGARHEAPVMVYISPVIDCLYLSRTAMEQLKIIPESFPQVGSAAEIVLKVGEHQLAECGCPKRSPPPDIPEVLPFKATAENTEKMRQWILSRYAASTFNTCPHQPLPAMTGPPMSIRVKPGTEPIATSRPLRVPIHWRDEVAKQLERDVALGVIERVPPGTPVTWLHNMVVTAKANGTPRRTVDLQSLNKVSDRETHHTVPPAKQARSIPKNQLKTVTDAWNGYHSVPVREEDRDKLTFITENGRYRYCRAPMGFLASGDAYTHRYDLIIADVPRITKCVDDVMLYDDVTDREGHWRRVIQYIIKVGKNGVILNKEKFQFAAEEVDFTAFRITANDVKPLPKYLKAIDDFPRPRNITDVRSWFGLINQVAHYGQLIETMAPFKSLLSPKTAFKWSEDLESAFMNSKKAIIAAIKNGVEIFDPKRKTCLQTDFSKSGLGYWLKQKHCACRGDNLECCATGWRITLAGSRFLRDAEKRYAPIEGECLGVAWALEDTHWFTLGCRDLIVATDHKPLLKILSDKCLDDLTNPRLFRLKLRTMRWSFKIVHVPGKTNKAADATSRNPSEDGKYQDTSHENLCMETVTDSMENEVVAGIKSEARHHNIITWIKLQEATMLDTNLQELVKWVMNGFPNDKALLPESVQDYWQYKERLCLIDGVLLLDHRMVIPKRLRKEVLQTLHSAHQGVSGMTNRAQCCVFWPGITKDIQDTRDHCRICNRMAPSQPNMPPIEPVTPTYPFQAIAADYFSVRGVKFLVIVDRFSGWPHLIRAVRSEEARGAGGLIRSLKFLCATFGVPEEVSSDGGPEFVASETEAFFQQWGIRHRLSSSYHPRSNGRAEVAVKSMKRLLQSATNPENALNEDSVIFGLLQYRNTPDISSGTSPAQILFGRPLKDRIPIPPGTTIFENKNTAPIWQEMWKAREEALRVRFGKQMEAHQTHSRNLPALKKNDKVQIQNQQGRHANKWDRTGSVIETLPYDQYLVRVDGSGRITRRNRKALRRILAFEPEHALPPIQAHEKTSTDENHMGIKEKDQNELEREAHREAQSPPIPASPAESLLPHVPKSNITGIPPARTDIKPTESTKTAINPEGSTPESSLPCPIERQHEAAPQQNDGDQPATPVLRRSTRIRRPPQFYIACHYCGQPGIECTMDNFSFNP